MNKDTGFILSASRRTDIPAFYMDWFMHRITKGFFNVKNPYSHHIRRVEADPGLVRAIVFWSKDFGRFIDSRAGDALLSKGYDLFFNFTVNSESAILEPNLPPLETRLAQMETLATTFGSDTIAWRFDPICFFKTEPDGPLNNNLTHLPLIAQKVSDLGIQKCVTSFFDPYHKIDRRLKRINRVKKQLSGFIDPPLEKKTGIIRNMADNLTKLGIHLHLCCEKEVYTALGARTKVAQNACIDGAVLQQLSGRTWHDKKDYGQRYKKGCRCSRSIDVGSYQDHPCPHDCIFCYARPKCDT